MNRSKKTVLNTAMSIAAEFVAIICGFILPRLVLKNFGSQYNGLTTSITQFLSMAVLLRGGIGGATRAALYKPLAQKNDKEVSAIVRATDLFMKKVGMILGVSIVAFAAVYSIITIDEFEWLFTFSLFLIIGVSTFVESFAGITYLILLQADQKLWVSSLLGIIGSILNTVIASILILSGASIHLVKLGSALVFVAKPIAMQIYVRKTYHLDLNCEPDNRAISQRWDAFWHQLASFVMNNTDVMVLTVFSNMLEVSVYSVYNMVIHNINRIILSFTSGLEAAFGNMIAKGENKALKENLSVTEWIINSITTVICSVAGLLIFEFVTLYTKGVHDVEYIRPAFGYIIIAAQFFTCTRMPSLLVVQAAGRYKETRNGAILEPILNISLSIALVIKYGLVGVAIGTLAATLFRTVQYSYFASKKIVNRNILIFPIKIIIYICNIAIIFLIWNKLGIEPAHNYLTWVLHGIIGIMLSTAIVMITSVSVFNKDMRLAFKKVKNLRKSR